MPFYTKNAIILPRQARDKHRENSLKEMGFLRLQGVDTVRGPSLSSKWTMHCQDRLGTDTRKEFSKIGTACFLHACRDRGGRCGRDAGKKTHLFVPF
jgi:hypothetical protein